MDIFPRTGNQPKLKGDIHSDVSTHVETVVLLSNKFEESNIYFDVGVEAKDYYRIKDRNKHN